MTALKISSVSIEFSALKSHKLSSKVLKQDNPRVVYPRWRKENDRQAYKILIQKIKDKGFSVECFIDQVRISRMTLFMASI
jgi:hypothetical protein